MFLDGHFFFYSFVEQKIKEILVLWSVINSSYIQSKKKYEEHKSNLVIVYKFSTGF